MTKSTPAGYDQDRLHTVRVREDAIFRSRISRSLVLAARARRSMPDGVPMAWMAGLYRHPPLFVDEGSGARFRDVDGNSYLEMIPLSSAKTPPLYLCSWARQHR